MDGWNCSGELNAANRGFLHPFSGIIWTQNMAQVCFIYPDDCCSFSNILFKVHDSPVSSDPN